MDSYIQGLEDGVGMIKEIYALTSERRKELFGSPVVSEILDKFDFAQLKEKLDIPIQVRKIYEITIVCDHNEIVLEHSNYPSESFISDLFQVYKDSANKIIVNEVWKR